MPQRPAFTFNPAGYGDLEVRNDAGRVVGRVWNRRVDGAFTFVVNNRRGTAPTFPEAKAEALRWAAAGLRAA